jgi:hypothetical protein
VAIGITVCTAFAAGLSIEAGRKEKYKMSGLMSAGLADKWCQFGDWLHVA